jgi:hypothetical protein
MSSFTFVRRGSTVCRYDCMTVSLYHCVIHCVTVSGWWASSSAPATPPPPKSGCFGHRLAATALLRPIRLGWWQAPRDRRRHCRPSLRRKSARRGAGSVKPGTQVLEGSPAPQSAVAPHSTHAVRQRAARQQLWPVSSRVTP